MPVKLGSRLQSHPDEARIEIVPLIDIMFFLLAAFMLVSLSLAENRTVKVNLPAATTALPDKRGDFVQITVNREGTLFVDRQPLNFSDLAPRLVRQHRTNQNLRVFISGDENARHGDVIRTLDAVRSAGIDRVAFDIRPAPTPARP